MGTKLDLWPFDIQCYLQDIVPALHQAIEGYLEPIQRLVVQGQQQQLSLAPSWLADTLYTVTASQLAPHLEQHPFLASWFEPVYQGADASQVDFYTFHPTWDFLQALLPTLVHCQFGQASSLGAVVHLSLTYAFCCAPLQEEANSPFIKDPEMFRLWENYMDDDEQAKDLWKKFSFPLAVPLAQNASFASGHEWFLPSVQEVNRRLLQTQGIEATPLYHFERRIEAYPRALFPFGYTRTEGERVSHEGSLDGFFTAEDIRSLYRDLPQRRKPPLAAICYLKAHDYVLAEWERHVEIEHFQQKKELLDQEESKMLRDWRAEERQIVHTLIAELRRTNDPAFQAKIKEAKQKLRLRWHEKSQQRKRQLREELFGRELGETLTFVLKEDRDPEQQEGVFLVPVQLYNTVQREEVATVRQWMQACPQEAERLQEPIYPLLWELEEEFFRRLQHAATHEVGLLLYRIVVLQEV